VHSSWQELVGAPAAGSHLLQLYDNEDFLAAAAGLFAAEGLARGEAIVLNGTEENVRRVCAALRSRDVDVEAALARGQIVVVPVTARAHEVSSDGPMDERRFEALTAGSVRKLAADPRFRGIRWWGETSSYLYQRGDEKAALAAEDLGNVAARKYSMPILCSFLCDRFDAALYHGMLRRMCQRHSHLIPANDYVRHRLAVNRAIAEVIGEIRGPLLQSLLTWKHADCELPSSEAVLFWLRDTLPDRLHPVLTRLQSYEAARTP
jgi:hypothetical protein